MSNIKRRFWVEYFARPFLVLTVIFFDLVLLGIVGYFIAKAAMVLS